MSNAIAIDREDLLSDAEVLEFIAQVPPLQEVYDHPKIHGALASLLGSDYQMDGHRHLHTNSPGSRSQGWHQDGTNVRHHQVWCVLAIYYPHDVPAEMGPTIIMPGTHFRNAPTDQLATYGNLKGQVPLAVKAGTVTITHYDLWHAATRNKSERPRHMLKFLFNRVTQPQTPTWNCDLATAESTAHTYIRKMVGVQGYSSDYYKEWELRKVMWDWIKGEGTPVPPGEFRNVLS